MRHNACLNGDLTIRAASSADVPAVLALWALARSGHATTSDHPEDVRRLVAEQPGSLLVAESDRAVVGALIAAWDGWRGNMYRLAVHPDRRRRGIAMRLVDAGESHLRTLGARRVTALVAYDDARARAFWAKACYPFDTEIGRHVRNF
jgi:ribosomal protein S18 acetylase RimI-like enzyme